MKLLKEIEYKGYTITIKGKFCWDAWKSIDYIELETNIYSNGVSAPVKDFTDYVYPEQPKKFLFWKYSKGKSLKQCTEEEIESNIIYCKNYIDNRIYEKEMTDGLMDSLDNLK